MGILPAVRLIAVGCVLIITVYLVVSGIPAIRKIGLVPFLFGKTWASTAAEPQYGILPFILTSVYGTAGAIVLGVPGRLSDGGVSGKTRAEAREGRDADGGESASRHPVGCVRPRRDAGARARYPQGVPPAGRRKPAGRDHCPGGHDPAVHHQSLGHGASRPCRANTRMRRWPSGPRPSRRISRCLSRQRRAALPRRSCSAWAARSARPWPS